MIIHDVTIRYGELRSNGYPSFSNTRIEVELHSQLEPGEITQIAIDRLHAVAKTVVDRLFEVKEVKPTPTVVSIVDELLNQKR
jgi:hypothetical protein